MSRTVQEGDHTKETVDQYDAASGQMALYRQTDSETTPTPNGGKTVLVNVYTQAVPGSVETQSGALRLREQQLLETRKEGGDQYVETFQVRRPQPRDPSMLGAYHLVSETVCTGNCGQRPPAKPKPEEHK